MKTNGRFLVSTFVVISLSALGMCQIGDLDDNDIPHENNFPKLPTLPTDWSQKPGPPDEDLNPASILDTLLPTSPLVSKWATSEPQVVATTQSPEPEPTEEPELESADFLYRDEDSGDACVRACLKAVFEVPYKSQSEDGNEETKTARIPLPKNAVVGGSCDGKVQSLNLQWGFNQYSLKMNFQKARSGDTDNWIAKQVKFSYDTGDIEYFESAIDAGPQTASVEPKSEFFESPWKKSYVCKSEDKIDMTSSDKADISVFRIEEIQIQPFMKPEANGTFSEGEPCESDKLVKPTSNVASVAVGATLGCLILIVIIVYAVGRRMGSITDRTGYKAVE